MEQIFDKIAKKNMLDWNLKDFKESHPTLYKTIIEAMNSIKINH